MAGVDAIVVGQGLAGSVLAWCLLERGARVVVVDREDAATASKAAAGLITPITGKNLAVHPAYDDRREAGRGFYRALERRVGRPLLHDRPLHRLFRDEEESTRWRRREGRPDLGPHVDASEPALPPAIGREHGGFAMKGAGFVDMPALLAATREHLEARDAYHKAEIAADELLPAPGGGWSWRGIQARHVVHCEGAAAREAGPFRDLPFRCAKGEALDLEIPGLALDAIVNRGVWLVRLPHGTYRCGSTYTWQPLDGIPTPEGSESILSRLRAFLRTPVRVVGHRAGVRPIVEGREPVARPHGTLPGRWVFNGLGSKGALKAPWFATRLADRLLAA